MLALKILRKIFPYHNKKQKSEKGCLDFQIGLCPGPHVGAISKRDYMKNIRAIEMIFKGGKKRLIGKLEKEMREYSKKQEFEKAAERRNQVFALKHIQDVALITSGRDEKLQFPISNYPSRVACKQKNSKFKIQNSNFRIEAYDISNILGKDSVGSMIVFDNSSGILEPNKKEYRKFKIKTIEGADDVGSIGEVLSRRLKNSWEVPNLVLIDGGKGQLGVAESVFENAGVKIPLVAVAKGPSRKVSNFQFLISKQFPISKISKKFNSRNIEGSEIWWGG